MSVEIMNAKSVARGVLQKEPTHTSGLLKEYEGAYLNVVMPNAFNLDSLPNIFQFLEDFFGMVFGDNGIISSVR